jgi:hypothetical protein
MVEPLATPDHPALGGGVGQAVRGSGRPPEVSTCQRDDRQMYTLRS